MQNDQKANLNWREVLANQVENRWDGHSQTFSQFVTGAYCHLLTIYDMMKDCSRTASTIWLIARVFESISINRINTIEDYNANQAIKKMIDQVDSHYKKFDLHHLECNNYQSLFMFEVDIALKDILLL